MPFRRSDSERPRLMFATSASGGLAHYVTHLWKPVSRYADPCYVTWKDSETDELVRAHVDRVAHLMDPDDPSTVDDVVRFALDAGVDVVDFHSASRAKRDYEYVAELLERLGAVGIGRVLHLHNVEIYRMSDEDHRANGALALAADAVLVGSHAEGVALGEIVDLGSRPVHLMRHGPYDLMDGGRFDQRRARRRLGVPADARVALFFGYLRREKRLDDLFRALPVAREDVPNAHLLVQCNLKYEEEMRPWLEARAREVGAQVRVGYVEQEDLEATFRAADLVVLPYTSSAASGVLNLARTFRLPVVVTHGLSQAALVDGVCGEAVPTGTPEQLGAAIGRILALPEADRNVLADGWDCALQDEEWEDATRALMDACEHAMGLDATSRGEVA